MRQRGLSPSTLGGSIVPSARSRDPGVGRSTGYPLPLDAISELGDPPGPYGEAIIQGSKGFGGLDAFRERRAHKPGEGDSYRWETSICIVRLLGVVRN